jgi:hypothetical protein
MKYLILFLFTNITLISCEEKMNSEMVSKSQKSDSSLQGIYREIDFENCQKDYGIEIDSIRAFCSLINNIKKWSKIQRRELETTNELGEANYYFFDDALKRINTKEYGESFQVLTEYYIKNDSLIFVFEKHLKYNRPIYVTRESVKNQDDKEYFDFEKSIVTENRTYFITQNTICQKCDSSFAEGNLNKTNERLRLQEKYNDLLKTLKDN